MIELIVFLGNPGKKYECTRHNAAWVLSDIANISENITWQSKFKGQYAKLNPSLFGGRAIHLLKPETFMNSSGESVIQAMSFFRLKPENILVVHDELEIKPGTLSFKWSGGLGGHNGLRSIKAQLGTADFFRLRIGIGRPPIPKRENPDITSFVLARFAQSELDIFETQIPKLNEFFEEVLNSKEPKDLVKKWAKVLASEQG